MVETSKPEQLLLLPKRLIWTPNGTSLNGNTLAFDRARTVRIHWYMCLAWMNDWSSMQRYTSPEIKFRPDSIVPGSYEDGLWRFWTGWLNRSGSTADFLFKSARDLFDSRPYLFNPWHRKSFDAREFEVLRDVIPFANNETQKHRVLWWQRDCMDLLRQKYNGDPRNIFLTVRLTGNWKTDRAAIMGRLCEFKGIKQKIAQLIFGWFQEAPWLEDRIVWEAIRSIPVIPADIWMMRLAFQTGLITRWKSDVDTVVSKQIADYFCQVCADEGIPHNPLMQAWWHAGAKVCGAMRIKKPGLRRQHCYDHCPLYSVCKGVVPGNYYNDPDGNVHHLGTLRWGDFQPHDPDAHVTPALFEGDHPRHVPADLSFVPVEMLRRSTRRYG